MGEVAHQASGIVTGMAGNYIPNYFRSGTSEKTIQYLTIIHFQIN